MLKSSGLVFITKLIIAGLNFATVIVISRWLGPVERGICSWYLVVIALSLVFSDMIAGPTAGFLLRNYAEIIVRFISYTWAIITSLIVVSIFFLLHKIGFAEWIFLFVLCWLNSANSLHLHLLLARKQFKWFNGLALITPAIVIACLFAFLKYGNASRMYYLLSLLIAWLSSFILGILLLKNRGNTVYQDKSFLFALVKEGFRNGLANQASHLAGLLNSRLIFFILPATVLGVFSNALSLAEASLMIPGSMGQVMYAMLLHQKKDNRSIQAARLTWWLTIASLLAVFVVVLLIPDQFYQAIFGQAFAGVKPYLLLLSAAMIFYGGYLVISYWQSANGWFMQNFYANLAAVAVNGIVSLVLFLNNAYSIQNGILALGAGFIVLFVVSVLQFRNKNSGENNLLRPPLFSSATSMANETNANV